jgi:(2Fe-2S) ferredoxin
MENMPKQPYERVIFVCCNQRDPGEAACANRGSGEFQKELKEHMKAKGIKGLRVSRSLCLGLCEQGPNVCVMPENVWYTGVTRKDLDEIKSKWIDSMPGR